MKHVVMFSGGLGPPRHRRPHAPVERMLGWAGILPIFFGAYVGLRRLQSRKKGAGS